MAHIHVGDPVSAELLGYDPLVRGRVESITLGISIANAAPSTQGLPSVDPVFTWVRLAQRVPVRIRIESVPPGITLVAGMTATLSVGEPGRHRSDWLMRLRERFMGTAGGGAAAAAGS